MVWIVTAGVLLFIFVLLYSCVIAGARADRKMNEIMKKVQRKG